MRLYRVPVFAFSSQFCCRRASLRVSVRQRKTCGSRRPRAPRSLSKKISLRRPTTAGNLEDVAARLRNVARKVSESECDKRVLCVCAVRVSTLASRPRVSLYKCLDTLVQIYKHTNQGGTHKSQNYPTQHTHAANTHAAHATRNETFTRDSITLYRARRPLGTTVGSQHSHKHRAQRRHARTQQRAVSKLFLPYFVDSARRPAHGDDCRTQTRRPPPTKRRMTARLHDGDISLVAHIYLFAACVPALAASTINHMT